ncbi:MAG: hypothetical protein IGQ45_15130 [Cyanobacterium sp. T60_A2020_053]|nr:hypothetical protein [Cyanobacterium sp. T60_A2020_053]
MFIYKAEELEENSIIVTKSNEIVFQGKTLVPSVAMSKKSRENVLQICQEEQNTGCLCIAIENNYNFILWKEKVTPTPEEIEKPAPFTLPTPSPADKPAPFTSPETAKSEPIESEKKNKPKPLIDQNFIVACEKRLIEYVGPIGKMIVEDLYEENPHLSKTELVELICEEIPKQEQKEEFKRYCRV